MSMIYCASFEPKWHQELLNQGLKSRQRAKSMSLSEIMTILIAFHQNHYCNFKHYCGRQSVAVSLTLKVSGRPNYLDYVSIYWGEAFPELPSYQRFALMDALNLTALCVYLKHCFGRCTGISFLDATASEGLS